MTVGKGSSQAVNYQYSYTPIQTNTSSSSSNKISVLADEYTPSFKELPTKGYIDNMIKDALNKIKLGENIPQNRRILDIFSNIARADSFELERKA